MVARHELTDNEEEATPVDIIGPATQGMIVLAIFVAIGTGVRLYRTRRDWMRKYRNGHD